jgi:UDP:flavonoid glycosyltransferase YjiC (YdhE family)
MRFLMTTQPALSHAGQLIPLAHELRRRGHAVLIASSASLARVLREQGFDARPFDPDWVVRPGDPVFDRTVGTSLFLGFPQVPSRDSVDALARMAADFRPDVIVREYSEYTGWAVATRLGIPLVTQAIIHRIPPPMEARVVQIAAGLATLAGVAPPSTPEDLLGAAYLDIVPPSFRTPWEHDMPLARPSRPTEFDGFDEAVAADVRPRNGRPLVYVTLGTIFNEAPILWRKLVTALSGLEVEALLTLGSTDPRELGPLPPNVRAERYVRQSVVLPDAAAVICHGGFNTLMGAFTHGVPALCLPLGADQPINAARCAAAGAGINGANSAATDPRGALTDPVTLEPSEIAAAVGRLLSEPAFAEAAKRLAREIEAMPPAAETAAFLERLARGASAPMEVGQG